MALDSFRSRERDYQMDLDSALEHLGVEKNRLSRSLDHQMLATPGKETDERIFAHLKESIFHRTMEEKAILTVFAKNTEPLQRAGMKYKSSKIENTPQKLQTGFEALDKQLSGGISSKRVTQVLGGEGGGKTTFIHYFIRNYLASHKEATVLYVSPVNESAILSSRVEAILLS